MKFRRDPGRTIVLGCGPLGCGLAWRFQEAGYEDFLIFEAADRPGGLAASVVDPEGFTWDQGGHVQFSHYAYYDQVLDQAVEDGWLWHERESWVWLHDRFIPYPFQNNIHRLDPDDRNAILDGLRIAARLAESARPENFEEWIRATFGQPMAEAFMFPYNFKVWGHPLQSMDWNWIGERVAVPDVARIERNIAENRDDVSWGPNNKFRFPLRGGTGAIWSGVERLIDPNRVRYGRRATGIDPESRVVRLQSGEQERFDTLVSSVPLDSLVRMTESLPATVHRAADDLRYSSCHILGIGLEGGRPESLNTKCWMYFPSPESPYYRVTVFSNYSPHLVPEGPGVWSLMAEVCESEHKPVALETLREWTLDALLADRLIEPDARVVSFWHRRLEHGYPTPFLGRDSVLEEIQRGLESHRIYSRGRFGGWKYEVSNQDHSFMQGVELADRLLDDRPEVTYPEPARANSGVFRQTEGEA